MCRLLKMADPYERNEKCGLVLQSNHQPVMRQNTKTAKDSLSSTFPLCVAVKNHTA